MMRGLPPIETGSNTRVRRWDAVILGSALPGLVAAARLGLHTARVLVIDEGAAARRPACLREPFFLGGAGKQGVLGACLRSLRVPLIDQRRIEDGPLAFQVALPNARLDIGTVPLSVDEWVAWGLAKPDESRRLAAALESMGVAERVALIDAPLVKAGRRGPLGSRRPTIDPGPEPLSTEPLTRGLPPELAAAPPQLATVLAAWTRALSNLGGTEPSDAARARLLGAPFGGSADGRDADGLRLMLRRRIESLYGEFRTLDGPFRLVSVNGQPGLAPDARGESGEVWVGRAFVINAPRTALAGVVDQDPVPAPLSAPTARWRRTALHWQIRTDLLPGAMARRVIIVGDEQQPLVSTNLVTLRSFPHRDGSTDLVAAAVVETGASPAAVESAIEARVAEILPFTEGHLERMRAPEPAWDEEDTLPDPPPGTGWPGEVVIRLPTKQLLYTLERSGVASLGTEGDLLLGWRGGDTIAANLA
ncbi:MAG: hypothetical protein CL938_10665 [Deltaproteobacteria bacterium]|jgi:hypothetical protein|nr:hypothetical protein [Deltaproteobacteria bacterium]